MDLSPAAPAAQVAVAGRPDALDPLQLLSLREVLVEMVSDGSWELHIPDAHGAPEVAHEMWTACRQRVVTHPCRTDGPRPRLSHDETRPSLPARERDMAVAHASQTLVYVPAPGEIYLQAPICMSARRRGLSIVVVMPSGDVRQWCRGSAMITIQEKSDSAQ